MAKEPSKKSTPTWSDAKAKLEEFDRAGMLTLVKDLYASNKDNRAFLHTRFGLGGDTLAPYKTTISRWIWPNISRGQDTSISKAKKAITDYKKAVGRPDEVAELMIFYCEQAVGFCDQVGLSDDSFADSLMSMFAQALKLVITLQPAQRASLLERLDQIRRASDDFGYDVGDEMGYLLAEYRTDG